MSIRKTLFNFTIAAALCATPALASPSTDRSFLRKALQGDNSEMSLGALAAQRGGSEGVREFGRALQDDHNRAKADATPVAQAHDVRITDQMAPEAIAEARKLHRLSGRAFDREFAAYMVKDHRKDIADFEKEARRGDQQTADLARRTLPVLHKHLQMALNLQRR